MTKLLAEFIPYNFYVETERHTSLLLITQYSANCFSSGSLNDSIVICIWYYFIHFSPYITLYFHSLTNQQLLDTGSWVHQNTG